MRIFLAYANKIEQVKEILCLQVGWVIVFARKSRQNWMQKILTDWEHTKRLRNFSVIYG